MKEKIIPFVLKNMIEHDGSANPKAVLGLVLKANPDLKKQVPNVLKTAEEIIKEYQDKPIEEIKKILGKIAPELAKKEKKQKQVTGPLKALPNAIKGKFKVRIAPSPSGPLHIGHAYGGLLNATYANMYSGKFLLRIEDTNPANIYPLAYEMIEDDTKWLTHDRIDEIVIQSDRLKIYHKYIKQLVGQKDAYVCTCDPDKWREMKTKKIACPCRSLKKDEQEKRYAKMLQEKTEEAYAEGEAVLRLKTDIKDKNPAMRDFSIARIAEHIHPRTKAKNRLWPLMVLSVAVDDHDLGITHVLNGKDHHDNGKKEAIIMQKLGWKAPEYKHWGRINFEGFKLSTSKTRIAIEEGQYTGWDDIRLATLRALRRRGYQADALKKFAIEIGLSLSDKTVSREEFWKTINAFNKEIVEAKANRFFFVENPEEIIIEDMPKQIIQLAMHPDNPKRGNRELKISDSLFIASSDLEKLETGKVHRLIDCCNFFKIEGKKNKFRYHSKGYNEFKNAKSKGKIIHYLPNDPKQLIDVEVLLDDHSVVKGKAEKVLQQQKEGSIIQFERQYFARIDSSEKDKVSLWYLHK